MAHVSAAIAAVKLTDFEEERGGVGHLGSSFSLELSLSSAIKMSVAGGLSSLLCLLVPFLCFVFKLFKKN